MVFHHKERKKKNGIKKQKDFSFLQLDSYIYYHFYSGLMCAPCLHVFVKRTGSKPLPYRFIEKCQCSSCDIFFVKYVVCWL